MKELIEYLRERYTPSEIVELLNEFDEDILKDFAIENDVCPRCAGELILHRWDEKHEYWGAIVFEPLSELRCSNCDETY